MRRGGCVGVDDRWPVRRGMQPLRRLEELAAQILELAERFGCHRTAAPTRGCPLEDRPDEREAALLAGKSTDHLQTTSGLPEGALEQVGVPDAAVVLGGEGQGGVR